MQIAAYNPFIDLPLRGKSADDVLYDFVVQGVYQNKPNKFIAYGALPGGPLPNDTIKDDHMAYVYTEPTQDYAAGFIAGATGLVEHYKLYNPQSDCGLDLGWSHPNSSVKTWRKFAKNDYFHNCRTGLPYSLTHIG